MGDLRNESLRITIRERMFCCGRFLKAVAIYIWRCKFGVAKVFDETDATNDEHTMNMKAASNTISKKSHPVKSDLVVSNLIGLKFSRLTVLWLDSVRKFRKKGRSKLQKVEWILCACECGNKIAVRKYDVVRGLTKSCGCLKSEIQSKKFKAMWKRGHKPPSTHGEASVKRGRSPEYTSWAAMKQRCLNPDNDRYADWGGRGIRVCKRWMKFENFLADMGRRPTIQHTLERKNNDGNYTSRNCRWATKSEQAFNRRN